MALFEPIPHSGALRGPAAIRESTAELPAPRHDRPQPYPSDASTPGSSVLGGSAMDDLALAEEGAWRSSGRSGGSVLAGRQARIGASRNYGSTARIGALLERGAAPPVPAPSASSSVLSRPSLNSSISRQQRMIDAAVSARVPDEELEKRVREEMKRIHISGREQLQQGRMDTVEASLALEASRIKDGIGADEMFHGLMPITQDVKQVLKAKVVKKQLDPKWQSTLALKPAFDQFDEDTPDREVRSFSLPSLPPLADTASSLNAACGPMLLTSYAKHLDFQWHDLREMPDGILEVDRLCPKPNVCH